MKMQKRVAMLWLAAIVTVGAVLRVWNLGEVPFSADEFLDINATVGYANTGVWQAWDHNLGEVSSRINPASDARAWLYRIQVAEVFGFLPPTETVARSVSVAWGLVTIVVVYLFATVLTKRRVIGLIAAAMFAVSVSGIEMDRTLRMYAMFAPVFMAFSLAVFLALERVPQQATLLKLHKFFGVHVGFGVLALALGALSLHVHALTANIVFVLLGYLVFMSFVARREGAVFGVNRYVRLLALGGLGAVLVMLFVPQAVAMFTAGIAPWENHWSYLGHVFGNYWHPLVGFALYAFGVGSLWFSTDPWRKRAGAWIDATVGMILFAAIFLWARNVGPQYIFFVQAFVMVGVASGVYHGAAYLAKYVPGKHVFAAVFAAAVVFVPNYAYFMQENNTYHVTSRAETPDYRKVFTYVTKHTVEGDALVTRNFRNYYWSGAGIPTYDFGSERDAEALAAEGKMAKVTVAALEEIMTAHPTGWVVLADNDEQFVTKEARAYIDEVMERVSHANIRGPIAVYRWGMMEDASAADVTSDTQQQ